MTSFTQLFNRFLAGFLSLFMPYGMASPPPGFISLMCGGRI